MRPVNGLFALGLCAKAAFGEIQISFEEVHPVNQADDQRVGLTNIVQERTVASNTPGADALVMGDQELERSRTFQQPRQRELAIVEVKVTFMDGRANSTCTITLTFTADDGSTFEVIVTVTFDDEGKAMTTIQMDRKFVVPTVNVDPDCEGEAKCGDDCNDGISTTIKGDPHMVGLLGQTIDWAGVDSAWYCLITDEPNFHVNVRVSAPMPEEFPDRQLISGLSILSNAGHSSLVVEVKDPYSTVTDGCPKESSVPCLADGGLVVLVDGEESAALQAPAENVRLPGSSPFVMSAANLPAECRPFGGDRIWATHFAQMMTDRRSLRLEPVPFGEWILQPDTLAAPTWCAKFLKDGGLSGLLSTRSNHATLRLETPVASVRVNVGVNYQHLETAPDGTVLVPELEFWQIDLGFDGLKLSGSVAGLMGDTSRFVLDDEGVPVTSGLGALHGPVKSYRVAGPFSRDFEKLHG